MKNKKITESVLLLHGRYSTSNWIFERFKKLKNSENDYILFSTLDIAFLTVL